MRKVLRYNFNMVEVMLAVVIVAVGMASTFVLFPVGLNAYKQAMAENSIADIAEYVTSFVRADCLVSALKKESTSYQFYTDDIAATFYSSSRTTHTEAVDAENPGDSWKVPNNASPSTAEKQAATLLKNGAGLYLVRQISGPEGNRIVDFSAIARVYLEDGDGHKGFGSDYFPALDSQKSYSNIENSSINIQYYLLPAMLELSWPTDVPYDQREKRYFRFEIFNDQFKPVI